ncbi:hypothetical protein C2S53_005441 [Perilla frutescens var. hirtella]|uniref:Uncharacterized protein n=1 Tax=Perilla frutescens var. hirtella TaxID=608512 RepID=A0AAD4P576_PERFH|nr:hypothetical protein C2S53_005441 [Perilla frutescens var. hirtella]
MEVEEENVKKMEMEIIRMLRHKEGEVEALRLLELVDDIDRLGLGYEFEEFINKSLQRLQSSQILIDNINDLHVSALYFRLLRQHGRHISTDIFERFKDSNKRFMESLSMDRRGMLSLYEASYLAFDGENILDETREFTRFHLNNMSTSADVDKKFGERVRHALELPSHHRMPRLEARWNIEMYDHKQNVTNQMLHKLAILDFNKVQSLHQLELQEMIRWWRGVGLVEKLSFARDRAMESFFWSVGMAFEPELSKFRMELAKVVQLIIVLDDIYDVYGTPQELEQLTRAVERWDINGVNHLPYYMKLFFLALYNTVNEMAYDTLKDQNHLVVYQLKEVWADLCKSFLREAKWIHYKREIPKFDEYLNNGLISSSGVVLLTHAFFFITPTVTDEAIESLNDGHASLRSSGTIFRLANDLISSKEDNLQAVSCYMHETGLCDEEVARAYVKELIDHNWKLLNKEITYDAIFSKNFIRTCCNLARIALCQYQDGDDHSAPSDGSRNRVKSVIVDPIQLIK